MEDQHAPVEPQDYAEKEVDDPCEESKQSRHRATSSANATDPFAINNCDAIIAKPCSRHRRNPARPFRLPILQDILKWSSFN